MGALKVSGVCRLGADPELRFTPSGAGVCSVRAIFQDRYKDNQSGEWKDGKSLWVNLIGWRQLGENMANSFKKGDEVLVLDGTMEVREYEKREGGGTGWSAEITVREIGPSIRFNAASVQRVDRQYDGPAAGNEDPWSQDQPARTAQPEQRRQPEQRQQPARGQWQGSGQPVVARFDPVTGQPLNDPKPADYDQIPFFHRTPGLTI